MNSSTQDNSKSHTPIRENAKRIKETCIFAMLGTPLFGSKIIMEVLPNVHLLGMLIMVYTIAFRTKALIPIYIYVIINGVYAGFATWWVPYLYIWAILWGLTMLLPRKMPKWLACILYPAVCSLYGFAYGTLYAPAQALLFGFNFEQTLAWIVAGIPFDVIHGVSNLFAGLLVLPLSSLLVRLKSKYIDS